ncbi:ATP-binding protein [Hydrogenophaga sp.]|uniref:sensor histidine kinase n=1 Tax=Hydrogenophaga sp. TaxID=1904254 RepID=UPI00356891A8
MNTAAEAAPATASRKPWLWVLLASALWCLVVWLVYGWFHQAALRDTGQQSLASIQIQARDLLGSVEKFEHLPYLVGAERALSQLLQSPQDPALVEQANRYLAFAQARTDVAAIYLIDTGGKTLAASNWATPSSFVGRNYRFRPYFRDAMAGQTGMFYGVGVTTGEPGAFIAAPIRADQQIVGVVAVKIDLTAFENKWREAGLHMAMADGQGVLFLTTQPDWRYRSLRPLSEPVLQSLRETRQYGDVAPRSLSSPDGPAPGAALQALTIDRHPYLVQARGLGRFDWQMLLFSDPAQPRRHARLAAEIAGLSLALVWLALALGWQYRRRQAERRASQRELAQVVAELDERIAARTAELTAANDAAVQTGKLAVLGQMAASISHEISQPLAALHTLADNAKAFLARQDTQKASTNLGHIGELCLRMGNIVGELKAFARKEPARLQPVSLRHVISSSLMLIEPLRHASRTQIESDATDLMVMGDAIRLGQVLVNLLRNGIDAMETQSERRLELRLQADHDTVRIAVRDHGPGLSPNVQAHLFEPFFTTKPSGKGLGLGLALSQAIVREMGGSIQAENAHPGARFELVLARAPNPARPTPQDHARTAD